MTADSMQALFNAVNAVGFVPAEDGTLTLIGEPPEWMVRFCPDLACRHHMFSPVGVFTFLESFIEEARGFWSSGKIGCHKSGLWVETDGDGRDHFLEASAVNTGEDKFLIIAHDHLAFTEKQSLIQKGREIALDRTLLQRMQVELESIRNQLETRVKLRTSELEEANRRLASELEQRKQLEMERSRMIQHLQQSQKMEAIGTMAGGIAHDFNNILAAVLGFTELGLIETKPGTTLYNNLNHVLRAAHRARDLIRQILTFSRQSEPERKPIQLSAIAAETLKLLRASMSAMITIRQTLKSDAYVLADPTQMHQVLMNLCTNAAHAMQADGGILEVFVEERQLGEADSAAFPELPRGIYLEMTVKDSGQGIEPELLPRIFDPFFTTKQQGEGTGMGLSVVHGIVKASRGAIRVESEPGSGTTFRILLPAMRGTDIDHKVQHPDMPRGREHILFVDDEPMQTEMAIQMLGRLGYHVTALTDCAEALEKFSASPEQYDLVVTDMNMPKMSGLALAEKLTRHRPDIPIILCSGYSELESMPPSRPRVIRASLMKPVAMRDMAETIRRILNESVTPAPAPKNCNKSRD